MRVQFIADIDNLLCKSCCSIENVLVLASRTWVWDGGVCMLLDTVGQSCMKSVFLFFF